MTELTLSDIKKVLILGSGTLGLRVGLRSAISGFDTVIYDINSQAFDQARQIHQKLLHSQLKLGIITDQDLPVINSRIHWTTDMSEAIADIDFVNESVTENLELKRKVWSEFGPALPGHAVMTTNTSYLLPSQIADVTGDPRRFCAFHFHDVFYANVVDIMPHADTASWIPQLLFDLGNRLNQTPVVVKKENSGYIFNSILLALIGAAGRLATLDVATIHDIDRSWMGNFKLPMGPFGILDEVGLDTAWHITSSRQDPNSQAFSQFLKSYVDAGKLGIKTGEGFYTYPDPAFKQEGFVQGEIL